jgi:hypothetical protein
VTVVLVLLGLLLGFAIGTSLGYYRVGVVLGECRSFIRRCENGAASILHDDTLRGDDDASLIAWCRSLVDSEREGLIDAEDVDRLWPRGADGDRLYKAG